MEEADLSKMEAVLRKIAARFGINLENLEITDNVPDEKTQEQIRQKLSVGDGNFELPENYFAVNELKTKQNRIKIRIDEFLTADIIIFTGNSAIRLHLQRRRLIQGTVPYA